MNRYIWGTGVIFLALLFWFWRDDYFSRKEAAPAPPVVHREEVAPVTAPEPISEPAPEERKLPSVEPQVKRDPLIMPFIVQAPGGEWDNVLFENACEEASLLMVASLLQGRKVVTAVEAKRELLALAAYQEEKLGHSIDTSVADTAKLLREYLEVEKGRVVELGSEQEMMELVDGGNVLILPADGQKLGNPFFTPPGPINHMLVVLAYDAKTGEYITHDPGTKRGALYRYQAETLWKAVRDYPTGATHLPNTKKEKRGIAIPLTQ